MIGSGGLDPSLLLMLPPPSSPAQSAFDRIHDHVRAIVERERARLDLGMAIALELQHPSRWRRLHIVTLAGANVSAADLVGWPASFVSASAQLLATDPDAPRP